MRKGKNVIGKDVVSFLDGKKVHSVKDLIIGLDNSSIVALLVDEGGPFGSSKVVPVDTVVSYGKDAVIISDSSAAVPADTYPEVQAILDRKDKLVGKRVMTEGGDEHGKISDVYFEEKSGEIVGFEVSEGFFKDAATGSGYLETDDLVNIGEDVVLIKSEAVYKLDAQTGGVQAKLETARDKAGDAAQNIGNMAKDKQIEFVTGKSVGREVKADDGTLIASEGQVITQQVARRADEKGKLAALLGAVGMSAFDSVGGGGGNEQEAMGKRAMSTVEAEDGSLVVAAGQRISEREIDRARRMDKSDELLVAAGVKQPQGEGAGGGGVDMGAAGQKVGDTLGQAGDKAGLAAGTAADKTGQVWDDFLAKVRDWKDGAGERVDEEKTKRRLSDIQDAIGRPTSKVILDKQDNVVLNLGDLITHEGVQRAYDAGMLDTLLDNVYKGEVTFTQEQMRAPGEGEATVEKASGNAQVVESMEQEVEEAKQKHEKERELSRQEAEQKRDENQQEREQREKERDQKSQDQEREQKAKQSEEGQEKLESGQVERVSVSGEPARMKSADTERPHVDEHEQASISDEQFERGGATHK